MWSLKMPIIFIHLKTVIHGTPHASGWIHISEEGTARRYPAFAKLGKLPGVKDVSDVETVWSSSELGKTRNVGDCVKQSVAARICCFRGDVVPVSRFFQTSKKCQEKSV